MIKNFVNKALEYIIFRCNFFSPNKLDLAISILADQKHLCLDKSNYCLNFIDQISLQLNVNCLKKYFCNTPENFYLVIANIENELLFYIILYKKKQFILKLCKIKSSQAKQWHLSAAQNSK